MIEGFTKQFDPNGVYKNIPEDHLKEMCGIVPNFFITSCMDSEDTLDSIAEGMDKQYGFGGFGTFAFKVRLRIINISRLMRKMKTWMRWS